MDPYATPPIWFPPESAIDHGPDFPTLVAGVLIAVTLLSLVIAFVLVDSGRWKVAFPRACVITEVVLLAMAAVWGGLATIGAPFHTTVTLGFLVPLFAWFAAKERGRDVPWRRIAPMLPLAAVSGGYLANALFQDFLDTQWARENVGPFVAEFGGIILLIGAAAVVLLVINAVGRKRRHAG